MRGHSGVNDSVSGVAAGGRFPRIDYANHPAYGLMFEPDPEIAGRAAAELEPLVLTADAARLDRHARLAACPDDVCAVARQVAEKGFAPLQAEGADIERLGQAAAPTVDKVREGVLQAQADGSPVTREIAKAWLDRDADEPVWAAARRMLVGAGVFEAVKDYFGAEGCKLRGLTAVVNRPGQAWQTNLFRDLEVETPPTTGFHVDTQSACILKTVIYLDDVGPEQGPFGALPGSHLWDQTGPGRGRRQGLERSSFRSRSREHRRTFASLPSELQLKAGFGGDVVPGSAECRALVDGEARLTGPRGQINLFDPEAIHRGGLVQSGERVALIAILAATWSS